MRLGIACALSAEVKTLTKQKITVGDVISLNQSVLVTLSGMGAKRARIAAKRLIDEGATALLSWGSAAALDPHLLPGTLAIPASLIDSERRQFIVHQAWHENLQKSLSKTILFYRGVLFDCPYVLTNTSQKRILLDQYGAGIADMESATIAQVATEASIPFLVIRAISDSAQMSIPERLVKAVNSVGEISLQQIFTNVILRPKDWKAIFSLARGMHAAQSSLTKLAQHEDRHLARILKALNSTS